MKQILLILSLTLICNACQKDEFINDGDYFHLENNGAKMPVWVKGNFDSDVMLVTLHGGPGDGGISNTISPGFQQLEDKYLMVYWDQRAAALTQGHQRETTLDVNQYIDDTDKLVQLLQYKYPNKKLFLLGHSWGGQLAIGYLGSEDHQSNFRGWIDLNGSIYGDLESQLMKDWIMDSIPTKLADPTADHEYWQYIVDWYDENPNPGNYSEGMPYWYVSALHGDVYDIDRYYEENVIPYGQLIFNSMFAMTYYVSNTDGDIWADDLNFTPEAENITIPSLMLWGENDGIVPAEVADYVYDHLSTPVGMKHVVKIPKCGHGPQNEHPEIFFNEVSNFIETYK
ncbi:MAG: alpha/beta hydrolase [Crocinitomicaceae bacterium]|nr:alpha/beta hydrolase [Crocinitomicaceae bacterium]